MNQQYKAIPVASLYLACATLAIPDLSSGATFMLDPMTPSQALIQACPPAPNTVSSALSSPAIWGGWRIMEASLIEGVGDTSECTESRVVNNVPPAWKVANPLDLVGRGRLVYSGSNDPAGFASTPLDLEYLQYLNFQYIAADHSTTFYIELWSGAGQCSKATIANLTAQIPQANVQIGKADFSACDGTEPVDFAQVRRVELYFDGVNAIDTELRAIAVVTNEPPAIACDYSRINGTSNLYVNTAPPYENLTVEFKVDNTGGSGSLVSVRDMMPAGIAQTGPLNCTNLTFGSPGNPPITWNSNIPLAANSSSVCTFSARLDSLAPGETKTNVVTASEPGQPAAKACPSTITRNALPPNPPQPIPALSEWAMAVTAAFLALFGGLALRRKVT